MRLTKRDWERQTQQEKEPPRKKNTDQDGEMETEMEGDILRVVGEREKEETRLREGRTD